MKKLALVFAIFVGVLSAKNICDKLLEYEFLHTDNIKESMSLINQINKNKELFDIFSVYFVSLGFTYHFCEGRVISAAAGHKESGEFIRGLENLAARGLGFNSFALGEKFIFNDNSEFALVAPQCKIALEKQLVSLYKRLNKASISEKEKQTILSYLLALGSLHLLCSIMEGEDEPAMLFYNQKYEDEPLFKEFENMWRIKIKDYIKGR